MNTQRVSYLFYIFLIGLGFSLNGSISAQNGWTTLPDMPQAEGFIVAQTLGNKIYIAGGVNAQLTATSYFYAYDVTTGSWSTLAPLPQAVTSAGMVALDGKLYVIGGLSELGGDVLSSLYVYDPATNNWSSRAGMYVGRAYFGTSVFNGKIYVVGGGVSSTPEGLASVEVYDPANNSWSSGPSLPEPRGGISCAVVDDKLYAIGGTPDGAFPATGTVWVLDSSATTWSTAANMPTPRLLHAACVYGGRIYVLGGSTFGFPGTKKAVLERYDPASNNWETLPSMPTSRHGLIFTPFAEKLYAIGGIEDVMGIPTTSGKVEVYDPATSSVFDCPADKHSSILSLYPNPAKDEVTIRLFTSESGRIRADLYYIDGRLVKSVNFGIYPAGISDLSLKSGVIQKGRYLTRIFLNDVPLGVTTILVQ